MYKFSNSIFIPSKLENVFSVFSELRFLCVIWDYIINIELITEGKINEGSKIKFIMLNDSNKIKNTAEVIEFLPNKALGIISKKAGTEVIYRYSFVEKNGGTEIQYLEEVNLENYQPDLAEQIFEIIKEEDYTQLEKIKDYFYGFDNNVING